MLLERKAVKAGFLALSLLLMAVAYSDQSFYIHEMSLKQPSEKSGESQKFELRLDAQNNLDTLLDTNPEVQIYKGDELKDNKRLVNYIFPPRKRATVLVLYEKDFFADGEYLLQARVNYGAFWPEYSNTIAKKAVIENSKVKSFDSIDAKEFGFSFWDYQLPISIIGAFVVVGGALVLRKRAPQMPKQSFPGHMPQPYPLSHKVPEQVQREIPKLPPIPKSIGFGRGLFESIRMRKDAIARTILKPLPGHKPLPKEELEKQAQMINEDIKQSEMHMHEYEQFIEEQNLANQQFKNAIEKSKGSVDKADKDLHKRHFLKKDQSFLSLLSARKNSKKILKEKAASERIKLIGELQTLRQIENDSSRELAINAESSKIISEKKNLLESQIAAIDKVLENSALAENDELDKIVDGMFGNKMETIETAEPQRIPAILDDVVGKQQFGNPERHEKIAEKLERKWELPAEAHERKEEKSVAEETGKQEITPTFQRGTKSSSFGSKISKVASLFKLEKQPSTEQPPIWMPQIETGEENETRNAETEEKWAQSSSYEPSRENEIHEHHDEHLKNIEKNLEDLQENKRSKDVQQLEKLIEEVDQSRKDLEKQKEGLFRKLFRQKTASAHAPGIEEKLMLSKISATAEDEASRRKKEAELELKLKAVESTVQSMEEERMKNGKHFMDEERKKIRDIQSIVEESKYESKKERDMILQQMRAQEKDLKEEMERKISEKQLLLEKQEKIGENLQTGLDSIRNLLAKEQENSEKKSSEQNAEMQLLNKKLDSLENENQSLQTKLDNSLKAIKKPGMIEQIVSLKKRRLEILKEIEDKKLDLESKEKSAEREFMKEEAERKFKEKLETPGIFTRLFGKDKKTGNTESNETSNLEQRLMLRQQDSPIISRKGKEYKEDIKILEKKLASLEKEHSSLQKKLDKAQKGKKTEIIDQIIAAKKQKLELEKELEEKKLELKKIELTIKDELESLGLDEKTYSPEREHTDGAMVQPDKEQAAPSALSSQTSQKKKSWLGKLEEKMKKRYEFPEINAQEKKNLKKAKFVQEAILQDKDVEKENEEKKIFMEFVRMNEEASREDEKLAQEEDKNLQSFFREKFLGENKAQYKEYGFSSKDTNALGEQHKQPFQNFQKNYTQKMQKKPQIQENIEISDPKIKSRLEKMMKKVGKLGKKAQDS